MSKEDSYINVTTSQKVILRGVSKMPLFLLRLVGYFLGGLSFLMRSRSRNRSIEFAKVASVKKPFIKVWQSYANFGAAVFEAVWIWLNPPSYTLNKTVFNTDPQLIVELQKHQKAKKTVLFLCCHLGASEAAIVYLKKYFDCGVLYQKQKNVWFLAVRKLTHIKHQINFFSMDVPGIRRLKKSLVNGGTVAISADQTPFEGSGKWVDFFGKPANTMTLAPKIASESNTRVVFVLHLRTFAGFTMQLIPLDDLPDNPTDIAILFNQTIEKYILKHPEQYLWAYDRYRVRRK